MVVIRSNLTFAGALSAYWLVSLVEHDHSCSRTTASMSSALVSTIDGFNRSGHKLRETHAKLLALCARFLFGVAELGIRYLDC